MADRVLYVVVCAAGAIAEVPTWVLPAAHEAGWDVHVVATEQAVRAFPQVMEEVEALAARPVRTNFHTTTGYSLPDPGAVLVMPATFNTIVKMAAGAADSYALTRPAEQVGRRTPIAVVPYVNDDFAAHPVYGEAVTRLRAWGVEILDDLEDVAGWLGGARQVADD